MRNRLILLPGWGLGVSPLQPVADALRGLDPHLQVNVEPLPALDSEDPRDWVDLLDAELPQDCWLGGWSLGGMLAAELAVRRGERCCGLITLASNACFVARAEWPNAMPQPEFDTFVSGCSRDLATTFKRFSLLCAQGAEDARRLARQLKDAVPDQDAAVLVESLKVLEKLDTRHALQAFGGPQLHLFGGLDALVPAEASADLLKLLPDVEVGVIERASHAFLLEDPHGVAASIQAFLHESGDD